jgi:hypothetical protein
LILGERFTVDVPAPCGAGTSFIAPEIESLDGLGQRGKRAVAEFYVAVKEVSGLSLGVVVA